MREYVIELIQYLFLGCKSKTVSQTIEKEEGPCSTRTL